MSFRKQLLFFYLTLCLSFVLVACSNSNPGNQGSTALIQFMLEDTAEQARMQQKTQYVVVQKLFAEYGIPVQQVCIHGPYTDFEKVQGMPDSRKWTREVGISDVFFTVLAYTDNTIIPISIKRTRLDYEYWRRVTCEVVTPRSQFVFTYKKPSVYLSII